ncbi:MAG: hypothetical protein GX297_06785 [Treponema sp.]|jgi:hypothetical protein|nr:hypothetical protein [Treponema sp.]
MKKMTLVLFSLFLLCLCVAIAFSKPQKEIIQPTELKKVIEQHPLVEKASMDEIWFDWTLKTLFYKSIEKEKYLPYTFDLYLTLTNGHTVGFLTVPNELIFHKEGRLNYIENINFLSERHKSNGKVDDYWTGIYLKDLCKATDTNYYDLYTILDNYNDFCKLLNSIPCIDDEDAEKVCAKYSEKHCVYLYRWSVASDEENKFIEIPEE